MGFVKIAVDVWINPLDNDFVMALARKGKADYLQSNPDNVWGHCVKAVFKSAKQADTFLRKVRFECGVSEFWVMGMDENRKWTTISKRQNLGNGECPTWLNLMKYGVEK